MLSASLLDDAPLDVVASFEDARATLEVHISGCQIVQAFVITAVIVMVEQAGDGTFEVAGQVIVFEQDTALQREVPALDLSLRQRKRIRRRA